MHGCRSRLGRRMLCGGLGLGRSQAERCGRGRRRFLRLVRPVESLRSSLAHPLYPQSVGRNEDRDRFSLPLGSRAQQRADDLGSGVGLLRIAEDDAVGAEGRRLLLLRPHHLVLIGPTRLTLRIEQCHLLVGARHPFGRGEHLNAVGTDLLVTHARIEHRGVGADTGGAEDHKTDGTESAAHRTSERRNRPRRGRRAGGGVDGVESRRGV